MRERYGAKVRSQMLKDYIQTNGRKHDGSLPQVGVNTNLRKDHGGEITTTIELIRSADMYALRPTIPRRSRNGED